MPGESPTKWQAQAHRFAVRRLESAVCSGDPLLRGDAARRRLNLSLIVSVLTAGAILAGFGVYGLVRPEPKIGRAEVVIDSDTGGVFVSRGGRLYPAMNLASALLAAGRGSNNSTAPSRTTVDTAAVAAQPRGPLLGIPGAPDVLPARSTLVQPRWTVCDRTMINRTMISSAPVPASAPVVRTTAIIGEAPPVAASLGTHDALLVSADHNATSFLIWQGRRSKIDATNQTIRLAFGFGAEMTARPISAALLSVIPQHPDLEVPSIVTPAVEPAYVTALGVHVGDVFALEGADRSRASYVALPDGVEPITPLVADLIRDEFDVSTSIPLVAPRRLRQAPRSGNPLRITDYPATSPRLLDIARFPVTCVSRSGISPTSTDIVALTRVPVPKTAKPVTVTRRGHGTVDEVYIRPGRGALLSTRTRTRSGDNRSLYLISDEGVSYPVGPAALSCLGYAAGDVAQTSPELIGLLPRGPTLDPDAAAHFYPDVGASASSLPSASGGR